MSENDSLLEVTGLTVDFSRGWRRPPVRAVAGVSLTVATQETVGLVGESGSGKTTIGRAILGLTPIKEGKVSFAGEDITDASYKRRRALSADMQAVFQDPYSSLNPARTVGQTLAETIRVQPDIGRADVRGRTSEMLERVGLSKDAASRYPAHFSGGQRQRIAIARALMARPRFVVCDEPTSALDLSVQAQVLNLLHELQADFRLSYLFISHDLTVVRHVSHRIIVLYHGRMMEEGDAATLCAQPRHPYTKALLDAAPIPDPEQQRSRRAGSTRATGEASFPGDDACPFAPRCPHVIEICRTRRPPVETNPVGTSVACHRWRELAQEPVALTRPEE